MSKCTAQTPPDAQTRALALLRRATPPKPTLVFPLEPFRSSRKPRGRLRHFAISKHQKTIRTTPTITHHTTLSPTRIANTNSIKTHTTKLRLTNNTEHVITKTTPNHNQTPQSEIETARHPSRKQDRQHTRTASTIDEKTACAYEDPMPRSRSANVTRLITHVLSNQVTRNPANTTLPILNTSNLDLKRSVNIIPSVAKPCNWNETATIQQMDNTVILRGMNSTILKLPEHPTNTLNKNLQRLLNNTRRTRTRSQSQETQISTNTPTNTQTRQSTTITTPLLSRPPTRNKRAETPLTNTTLAETSNLVPTEPGNGYSHWALFMPYQPRR
jgi:hypothetical protein